MKFFIATVTSGRDTYGPRTLFAENLEAAEKIMRNDPRRMPDHTVAVREEPMSRAAEFGRSLDDGRTIVVHSGMVTTSQ